MNETLILVLIGVVAFVAFIFILRFIKGCLVKIAIVALLIALGIYLAYRLLVS
ncbi:MAG: hypothetical protein IBX68_05280 [Dehalococcoidia bacterium]|nr:hypothetical protein [Dehalococcoidia bacterium]